MSWWKNKTEQNTPATADNGLSPQEQWLTQRFAQAIYAQSCCTLAYRRVEGGVAARAEWLTARNEWVDAKTSGWVIRRHSRYALEPEKFTVDQIVMTVPLPFFEAICKLSTYETSQMDLGNVPVNTDVNEFCTRDHYRIVALREGIGFDKNGQPRPTDTNGYIVGDGEFEDGMQEALLQTAGLRVSTLPALPKVAPIIRFDKAMLMMGNPADEIAAIFVELSKFLQSAHTKGWHHKYKEEAIIPHAELLSPIIKEARAAIKKHLALLESFSPELAKSFDRALLLMEYYLYSHYAGSVQKKMGAEEYISHSMGDLEKWQYTKKRGIESISLLLGAMTALGWQRIDATSPIFKKLISTACDDTEGADKIVSWALGVTQDLEDQRKVQPLPLPASPFTP